MSKKAEETQINWIRLLFWLASHLLIAVFGVPAFILGFLWAGIAGGFAAGRLTFAAMLVGSGVMRVAVLKEAKEEKDDEPSG